MKNRTFYDPRNPSTRIIRGIDRGPSGRQINMGADKANKQARKTRSGACAWLKYDDEVQLGGRPPIFNPAQRDSLIERANGGSSKLYKTAEEEENGGHRGRKKANDPFTRREDENENEYIVRIKAHMLSM